MEVRTVLAMATASAPTPGSDAPAATPTTSTDPAPMQRGELEVEDDEDHAKRDNDIINSPAVPDYDKILFAPDDRYAFTSKEDHDHALAMVKEVLQTKETEAEAAWLAKKAINPKDPEVGAKLFGNMPGTARYMPEGLREFRIDLIPGAQPVRQGVRRFTAEETAEITRQIDKMLRAEVIEAITCYPTNTKNRREL